MSLVFATNGWGLSPFLLGITTNGVTVEFKLSIDGGNGIISKINRNTYST